MVAPLLHLTLVEPDRSWRGNEPWLVAAMDVVGPGHIRPPLVSSAARMATTTTTAMTVTSTTTTTATSGFATAPPRRG